MLTAIISDIHGNYEALCAVLAQCRRMMVREVVCQGDIIGYGPNPRECIDLGDALRLDVGQHRLEGFQVAVDVADDGALQRGTQEKDGGDDASRTARRSERPREKRREKLRSDPRSGLADRQRPRIKKV